MTKSSCTGVFWILLCAFFALLVPHSVSAAVGYGGFTTGISNNCGSPCTLVAPTMTGSDKVLIVAVAANASGDNNASATYNGVSIGAPIESVYVNFTQVFVWVIKNPASGGTLDFATSFSGSAIAMHAVYYTGVDQTTTYRTGTVNSGTSNPATLSVTNSQANDLIVGFFSINDTSTANGYTQARIGANQTYRNQLTNASAEAQGAFSEEAGASGTVIHSWDFTNNGNNGWGGIAIPLIPADSGGSGPVALSKPPNNLGLVGYWSFNDGTGTLATDFSGNGNTGTLTNGPTWTNGKRGKALNFDGSDDYVTMGTPSALSLTNVGTLAAWFKTNSSSGFPVIVGNANFVADSNGYLISLDDTTGTARLEIANGSGFVLVNSIARYDDNQWHFMVGTWDGSNLRMYVDGVLANSPVAQTLNAVSGVNPVIIGKDAGNNASLFAGSIDEVRIYNRALSATEVSRLYGSDAVKVAASSADLDNGSTFESGLAAHWTFDGADTVSTITDRSGQGNNGYFVNSATSSAKTIGKLGQAFTFDGTNDYAFTPMTPPASYQSVGFWIKTSAVSQSILGWTNGIPTSGSHDRDVYINADGTVTYRIYDGTAKFVTSVVSVNDNAWHHVVVKYDSTPGISIYVDGVKQGNTTSTGAPYNGYSTPYLTVGIDDFTEDYFIGSLDDIRVYNRALTDAEIKQLYRLGAVKITQ